MRVSAARCDSDLLPAESPQELLTALINDLAARRGSGLLLVMDDYHAIRDFAVHELVGFLLANQPAGFHLVIGTREDPPLPLARLRPATKSLRSVTRLRFTSRRAVPFSTGR